MTNNATSNGTLTCPSCKVSIFETGFYSSCLEVMTTGEETVCTHYGEKHSDEGGAEITCAKCQQPLPWVCIDTWQPNAAPELSFRI
jgi:hypothetical protein